MPGPPESAGRLLDPKATAAIVLGAHDWTKAGLGHAQSFLHSANGVVKYLSDRDGLGIEPELIFNFFDSPSGASDQLVQIRDALDACIRERRHAGRPVADVLIYYIGHGHSDDEGHLSLLVSGSSRGMEAETGIKALDLAKVLKVAAPQQRRLVVLDCCFSEAAARAFIGMSASLDQAVAATAAKDLREQNPTRGSLLLCSSPISEVSIGAPDASQTLFTGAVLEVLRLGAEGYPPALSFAELRDRAYHHMLVSFGKRAPRPVLHAVNQAQGDLTRLPAFPNRAPQRLDELNRPINSATTIQDITNFVDDTINYISERSPHGRYEHVDHLVESAVNSFRSLNITYQDKLAIWVAIEAAQRAPYEGDPKISSSRLFLGVLSVGDFLGSDSDSRRGWIVRLHTNVMTSSKLRAFRDINEQKRFYLDRARAIWRLDQGFSTNVSEILNDAAAAHSGNSVTGDAIAHSLLYSRSNLLSRWLEKYEVSLDELRGKPTKFHQT